MISDKQQEDKDAFVIAETDNELTSASWVPKPGEHVEMRCSGRDVRRGVIEAVMKDNSGFWLAADGVEPRMFVLFDDQKQSIRHIPVSC